MNTGHTLGTEISVTLRKEKSERKLSDLSMLSYASTIFSVGTWILTPAIHLPDQIILRWLQHWIPL